VPLPTFWQLATASGIFPEGIETDPDGVEFSFHWNTNVDLEDGDDDVLLRVTADDGTLAADDITPIGISEPLESALFHVDNNDEPIVLLENDIFISNPDERRGIPVPFRVFDDESDVVEVILQWRYRGEEFPPLAESEIDAVLADPELRIERHVCSEYPRSARGHVVPVDASTVQLNELAAGESWIVAHGLEGRTLELLRASSIPAPIAASWSENPLSSPSQRFPFAMERARSSSILRTEAPGGCERSNSPRGPSESTERRGSRPLPASGLRRRWPSRSGLAAIDSSRRPCWSPRSSPARGRSSAWSSRPAPPASSRATMEADRCAASRAWVGTPRSSPLDPR
jgi:hypothetical protein